MSFRPATEPAESDERLVSLAKAGDTASFGELVERHKEKAVRLAFAYVKNFEDAKDVAQEAFVKAHGSLRRFDGKSKFYTWLFRIVVNQAIDHTRKRREKSSSGEALFENIEDASPGAAETARKKDERAMLEGALGELTTQQRTVLVLTYFEQMSTAETAAVMDVSEGTVKATRFQALAKLKGVLERKGEIR